MQSYQNQSQSSTKLVKLWCWIELEHATDNDTSDLAAKKDFVALKVEVDKLDINKLANVPTSLNNLKTKVDDLDAGKFKPVPVALKRYVMQ